MAWLTRSRLPASRSSSRVARRWRPTVALPRRPRSRPAGRGAKNAPIHPKCAPESSAATEVTGTPIPRPMDSAICRVGTRPRRPGGCRRCPLSCSASAASTPSRSPRSRGAPRSPSAPSIATSPTSARSSSTVRRACARRSSPVSPPRPADATPLELAAGALQERGVSEQRAGLTADLAVSCLPDRLRALDRPRGTAVDARAPAGRARHPAGTDLVLTGLQRGGARMSARSNLTGSSSCSYVHERGSRSGRQRLNWAVCRNRTPSMCS